jgi:hypothetical protein
MAFRQLRKATPTLLAVGALLSVGFLAGCDEYVQVDRNPEVRIARHATWAWRPAPPPTARDSRPVISRDEIPGRNPATREDTSTNDIISGQIRVAVERNLSAKGFVQAPDPATADFLVDFHAAVRGHTARQAYGYPAPGLVCGPFGCWAGGGWGVGYENVRFREGTIVFDFVRHNDKKLAFRAVGAKPVHYDRTTFTQGDVNSLVHRLLQDLKPGR